MAQAAGYAIYVTSHNGKLVFAVKGTANQYSVVRDLKLIRRALKKSSR